MFIPSIPRRYRRQTMGDRMSHALASAATFALLFAIGCDNRRPPDPAASQPAQNESSASPADHLTFARKMLSQRAWDAAADAAYKTLVQQPDSFDAMLIASEAEAGRGNHQRAVDLAAAIDPSWRLAERVVNVHARSLFELGRTSDAADVLLAGLAEMPQQSDWRHRAWGLLTRIGRREEASRQAETLCRTGQATEPELNSLIRRTEAYPTQLPDGTEPTRYFEPGLGIARWYFTEQQYDLAIRELHPQSEAGFATAAGSALYGRLLAETQAHEQFPRWHAACDLDAVTQLGDYWAALGTYFFDLRQFEASARALLDAVQLNPTDRRSTQRLAKVFDALGKPQQAELFRRRGIDLAQSEAASDSLQTASAGDLQSVLQARETLMNQTLKLERPFESLAWASRFYPPSATQRRQAIEQKRRELAENQDALVMARESALIGVDPDDFDLGQAYQDLIGGVETIPVLTAPSESDPLAEPRLVNVASQVGLDFQWYKDTEINLASIPIHESIGGAIAVIDYDLDGWPDVYLAQGSGDPPTDSCTRSNVLMRNLGGEFIDATADSAADDYHYSSGLAAGDVNQDGFADLFLGSLGKNRLLINNGDGTFRDASDQLGEVADRFSTSLAIADITGDALPELFEGVYIEMDGAFALPQVDAEGREIQPSPLEHFAEADRWYRNRGDGRFSMQEISRQIAPPGTSLGVIVTDFNGDGSNEVFVGNDVRPNHLLMFSDEGNLLDAADAQGVANGFSGAANGCMGIAAADFNRDGTLDLHITNFNQESANLYLQSGQGGFTDFAVKFGLDKLSEPYVGFGTKAIDFDRDGWRDLAVTNGHIFDMRQHGEGFQMPPQLLMNYGTRFESVTVDDDSGYWDGEYLGRAMAMLDFDRDGRPDLLINHLDLPLALLHNQTQTPGRAVSFELAGTTSERDAIGTRIVVQAGGQTHTGWVTAGDGYLCSDEPVVEFGLGKVEEIERVDVYWPAGTQQSFSALSAGSRYLIVEGHPEVTAR